MGIQDKRFMDTAAWAGNVSSSVLIIFVNKVLMSNTGYGFRYGIVHTIHIPVSVRPAPSSSFVLLIQRIGDTNLLACACSYYLVCFSLHSMYTEYLVDTSFGRCQSSQASHEWCVMHASRVKRRQSLGGLKTYDIVLVPQIWPSSLSRQICQLYV